jgi:DNA (cytosine-5)-methyltransferase 1
MKNKKLRVLDLFSGCGGLSYGFMQAGFNVVAGIDNWEDSLETFKKNHKGAFTKCMDLGSFEGSDLDTIVKDIDVVIGGPPCQGFSISGKRDPNDPRNKLYSGFVKTIEYLKPNAFVMENVPNLVSMESGRIKDTILQDFSNLGYDVKYKVLLASDYGVPQNRKRVVFVGIKGKNTFQFVDGEYKDQDKKRTCHMAMSDLPEDSIEDGSLHLTDPLSCYQQQMRKKTNKIFNHVVTIHSEKTKAIISLVPDGGNYKNLPPHLQNTRKVNIAWTRYNSKKPSLTIDTGHRHHFHYKWNRVPTVRESARLQSFPDDFIFLGSKTSQYKQVGNAVPPLLAEAIASELKTVLLKI